MIKVALKTAVFASGILFSGNAWAEDLILQPVQVGAETVRFVHGQATVDLRQTNGVVEIYTLPRDHGGLAFGVAVYNAGGASAIVDTSNFSIEAGKQQLAPLTVDRLVHKAEHRAGWSKFGTRLLGGLAAGLAASATDTYSSTLYTRHAIYRATYSTPSIAGQIEANQILDRTGARVADIQDGLDATRAQLGESVIQTTTVDPGRSVGGRIVFDKLADGSRPQTITMRVNWNGETYTFGFRLAKSGTPMPSFASTPPAQTLPAASPVVQSLPLTNAAFSVPQAGEDRNSFPHPLRTAAAAFHAPSSPMINTVVQKTADYYINPLHFEDGSVATHFAAAGSTLSMTVRVAGVKPASDSSRAKLTRTICDYSAMRPVVDQGGTIDATITEANGHKAGTIRLDAQACSI